MRKTLLLLATLALSLTALTSSGSRSAASPAPPRPKGQKLHKKEKAIPGSYIVVLDSVAAGEPGDFSQADQITDVLVAAYGGKVKMSWKHALNGYAASGRRGNIVCAWARVGIVETSALAVAEVYW